MSKAQDASAYKTSRSVEYVATEGRLSAALLRCESGKIHLLLGTPRRLRPSIGGLKIGGKTLSTNTIKSHAAHDAYMSSEGRNAEGLHFSLCCLHAGSWATPDRKSASVAFKH